jgi:hypothetical protein
VPVEPIVLIFAPAVACFAAAGVELMRASFGSRTSPAGQRLLLLAFILVNVVPGFFLLIAAAGGWLQSPVVLPAVVALAIGGGLAVQLRRTWTT